MVQQHPHVALLCFYIALVTANNAYRSKLASGKATHQTLFALDWKVERLSEEGRQLLLQFQILWQRHAYRVRDDVTENFPRRLTELREQVATFVKGVTPRVSLELDGQLHICWYLWSALKVETSWYWYVSGNDPNPHQQNNHWNDFQGDESCRCHCHTCCPGDVREML